MLYMKDSEGNYVDVNPRLVNAGRVKTYETYEPLPVQRVFSIW